MEASLFYQALKRNDFGPFVGVPCSILAPFLEILDKYKEGIIATNEGEAIGIACGLYLAGKKPVVFMQNSGLCNALNPLTSLISIYKIPLLLIITLRGEPGTNDTVQHEIMGQKTQDFLKLLEIEYKFLSDDSGNFNHDLLYLKEKLEKDLKPAAFLLRRDIFKKETSIDETTNTVDFEITRKKAIDEIAQSLNDNCLVVTTNGKISREYYNCEYKRGKTFYMLGSMGCASAIGLGIAMDIKDDKKVVVIDGDGAVLMKMGNLATIGNIKPMNLIHIVLDNQCHESTGGQKTASSIAHLDKVAGECGYFNTYKITKLKQVKQVLRGALNAKGPSFILIKISRTLTGDAKLARPVELPPQIKENFMRQIKE